LKCQNKKCKSLSVSATSKRDCQDIYDLKKDKVEDSVNGNEYEADDKNFCYIDGKQSKKYYY
jgi:hypothetical protein